MMWGWNGGMMGSWGLGGIWMGFFWLIIIGLVVWGIIVLARHTESRSGSPSGSRALEVVKERYVRGEITREQYETMRKDVQ